MTTSVERSEIAVQGLSEAWSNVRKAIVDLREVRDSVFNVAAEKGGLHSIDAEIGTLELVSSAISQQYYSWAGYNDFRKKQ